MTYTVQSRVIGGMPTIGLYATIDPRTYPDPAVGGKSAREQQEPIVRHRLELVKSLLESIVLSDGTHPRVVCSTILVGGPREAAAVCRDFEVAGVNIVVNSMATWSMGYETDATIGHPEWIVALEAMNGTQWPGAVLLNARRAAANAHLRPVYSIYPPDVELNPVVDSLHPETIGQLAEFVVCAAAVVKMRGTSYASMGHISMGIGGSENISDVFDRWFGMKLIHVDQLEILKRIEKGMFDPDERIRAATWFMNKFVGRIDPSAKRSPAVIERLIHDWLVPMTLVVRGLMRGDNSIKDSERAMGLNALVGGTTGQRYWTDYFPNFDFTEAWLSSTFDWNGSRPPITVATENDGLNGMGMLLANFLTGRAALFADLRTYWSAEAVRKELDGDLFEAECPDGFLDLRNSGPAALDWSTDPRLGGDQLVENVTNNTVWQPAALGYFPHDGLSTQFRTPGRIPVTLLRLNRIGLDLTLSIAEGHTVELPGKLADAISGWTNPTWPETFVTLGPETRSYMERGNDPNHVVAAVGHIGCSLVILASMLRIPVDCHTNFEAKDALRPTLWKRLGGDREACRRLGPRYA